MKKELLIEGIAALLVLLFLYTALSKLLDFQVFRGQLEMQPFPRWLDALLLWALPLAELGTGSLLFFKRTRRIGLYAAAVLMAAFTGYVGLVLMRVFGTVPCSCGGVLESMGWEAHFAFNLFFLALPVMAIYLHSKAGSGLTEGDGSPGHARQKGGQPQVGRF